MKKWSLLLLVGLIVASFLRFYNLPTTTRFTRDESSNLRDMYRIYRDRDLTLLGPVDPTKTLIHPSLSFYMLMPFAVLGDFTPQSPAYGTAFFGVLTVIVFALLARRIDARYFKLSVLLAIIWAPLVIMSRWAWNPHLVPFIQGLALLVYFQKWKRKDLLAGILFGLTFHLHFFAFASFIGFWLAITIHDLTKKKFRESILLGMGFAVMIIPFVIFDLKNPPGLFFGEFLQNNLIRSGVANQSQSIIGEFLKNIYRSIEHLGGGVVVTSILAGLFGIIAVSDIVGKNKKPLLFLIPVLVQIFFITYLPSFEPRYFYLALAFFWIWLVFPRSSSKPVLVSIILMMGVSAWQLGTILTESPRAPGGYVADEVTKYVSGKIRNENLMFSNIAVLASPDKDALGQIYRHTLDMQGITFRLENQFDITDNLFIVTTSDVDTVRSDPANVMTSFRDGRVVDTYHISGTDWKVLLFNK